MAEFKRELGRGRMWRHPIKTSKQTRLLKYAEEECDDHVLSFVVCFLSMLALEKIMPSNVALFDWMTSHPPSTQLSILRIRKNETFIEIFKRKRKYIKRKVKTFQLPVVFKTVDLPFCLELYLKSYMCLKVYKWI